MLKLTNREQRRDALARIDTIVNSDRNKQYGEPEDSFADIAERWQRHIKRRFKLDVPLSPKDVAAMMVELKLSRASNGDAIDHEDTWLDIGGYGVCGYGIVKAQPRKRIRKTALDSRAPVEPDAQAALAIGNMLNGTEQMQGDGE